MSTIRCVAETVGKAAMRLLWLAALWAATVAPAPGHAQLLGGGGGDSLTVDINNLPSPEEVRRRLSNQGQCVPTEPCIRSSGNLKFQRDSLRNNSLRSSSTVRPEVDFVLVFKPLESHIHSARRTPQPKCKARTLRANLH